MVLVTVELGGHVVVKAFHDAAAARSSLLTPPLVKFREMPDEMPQFPKLAMISLVPGKGAFYLECSSSSCYVG